MQIVRARPPLFNEIDAAFNVAGKPILYCWGTRIYDPEGAHIDGSLIAHEEVHRQQQGNDVEGWWRRYIVDQKFRLEQEIPAHLAEYRYWLDKPGIDRVRPGFRTGRQYYLMRVAKKLAAPLYGEIISVAAARKLLAAA